MTVILARTAARPFMALALIMTVLTGCAQVDGGPPPATSDRNGHDGSSY